MSDVSRRDFIKIAGTTAGVAIATAYSPLSYAGNEKVTIACIGTGGQGGFHIQNGLNGNPDVEVVAVCDALHSRLDEAWKLAGGDKREVKKYTDYKKLLDEVKCDAVVIATPLFAHHQIVLDCLDAGKWVFCEKTLAYDVEQCRSIVTKCNEVGKWLQVGHQRRYNPEYNKALWMARGGDDRPSVLGRINHVNAQWHRNNDWRRPVPTDYVLTPEERAIVGADDLEKWINWRLYFDRSRGGLITELATHQLDVVNWFLGAMPKRCCGFGGIDYWKDGREVHDNIVMIYEYEVDRDAPSFAVIPQRNELQRRAELGKPYNVRYTYSSICSNAKREYGEFIQGDRGSIYLTEQKGCTMYPEPAAKDDFGQAKKATTTAEAEAKNITGAKTRAFSDEAFLQGIKIEVLDDRQQKFDNPAVVDRMQFTAFANDIRNGTTPKANQMTAIMSAVAGFAAIESMQRGGVTVDIDPALYIFDFETPDPFRYDFFEETEEAKKAREAQMKPKTA